MKKIFLALLIAAMFLSTAAIADSRVAQLDNRLFLSLNGLLEVNENEIITLDARAIKHLRSDGEYLYYVAVDGDADDDHQEILMRMDKQGNAEIIGESRFYGAEYTFDEDYANLSDYCFFPGYGDMTVYGDHIYFIGANGVSGSYITVAANMGEFSGEYETRYETASSLYRMDKDGSNLMELIPDLGNSEACFDVNNGVIAVATCWRNTIYAYDFSDFRLYDLDGNLIREIENTSEERHNWIYKEDCEFTCIVVDIRTNGDIIYASLGDSEGDFANGRLTNMDDPDHTLAYEAFYIPAIIADDGVALFTSDAESAFWDEIMETTTHLYWENGMDSHTIANIPYDFVDYRTHLDRVGDMLYLSNGESVLRVSIHGGELEKLGPNGFETASTGSYFLPDSNIRLYTGEELRAYDKETLGFMRNEILARHGYVFKKDKYKNHFSAQPWYQENPGFAYSMLNEIEMENIETIKKLEAK